MNDNVLQWRQKPMPGATPPNPDSLLSPHEKLRLDAEKHIEENTTQPSLCSPLGTDVLALLYRIASSPTGGSDALKLLHEFQVHQVELDMQYRQLEANEQLQAKEIAHYRSLFNSAPVGYLLLSTTGKILEANRTIVELLGVGHAELCTSYIDDFLDCADKTHWHQLLKKLREGAAHVCGDLTFTCREKKSSRFQVSANHAQDSTHIQIVVSAHKQ